MYYIYILSNRWHTVFYTGLTNDIVRRTFEHKNKVFKGAFTRRYNCDKLLYFEMRETLQDAMNREREVKKLHRQFKMQLILAMNPKMDDLAKDWAEGSS